MSPEKMNLRKYITPFLVGTIPLVASYFISIGAKNDALYRAQIDLEQKAERIINYLALDAQDNLKLLDGLNGIISSARQESITGRISEETWNNYLNTLRIPDSHPEIKYVGMMTVDKDSGDFVSSLSYEIGLREDTSYLSIFEEKNKYYSSSNRIQEIVLNSLTVNNYGFAPLAIVNGAPTHFGVYRPIYETFSSPESIEERNKKLTAVVFYYIDMEELFDLGNNLYTDIGFTTRLSTPLIGDFPITYIKDKKSFSPKLRHLIFVPDETNTWIVTAYSLPAHDESHKPNLAIIWIIGFTLGVLLFLITLLITSRRERAVKLAKRMMSSLRKTEEDFRNAFRNTKTGMVLIYPDLRCGKSNTAFQKITGFRENEITGKSWNEFISLGKSELKMLTSSRKTTKTYYRAQKKLTRKNGKKIWITLNSAVVKDKKGTLLYSVANIEDITKERNIQETLRENEERMDITMKAFKIGVWDMDAKTGTGHWEGHMDKALGLPESGKVNLQDFVEIIHPDDKEETLKVLSTAIKKKKPYDTTYRVLRKDGSVGVVNVRGMPIPGSNGRKYFGLNFDVTEANKLNQLKANFISVASHQLRTPLTAIRWFREMITDNEKTEPLTPKQKKYLEKIEDSSVRMLDLVNDLLQVSRLDNKSIELNPVKFSLCDSTKKIVEQVAIRAKDKKQKFNLSCTNKKTFVYCDKTLCEQVIQNLMTNAMKYSAEKSTVKINISDSKDYIKWEIKDNGIGISQEDKSKVFQQFFRSKEATESGADGSGLGLYIAKAIIESSGGSMDYKSTHGKGSTFWFTLPKKK